MVSNFFRKSISFYVSFWRRSKRVYNYGFLNLLSVLAIFSLLTISKESTFSGMINVAVADTILFQDGFEAGQDTSGNFINWDETPVYGGVGTAGAFTDTIIVYQGDHSARFELSNGAQGGWAYASKIIPWPSDKKLWYSCCLRNGPRSQSNVNVGGLYFMEAYIIHPSGYRERANIETHPRYDVPDTQFILRMAYRGRDGQRHRQNINICPVVNRERWYKVKMLVDLSGSNPYYAWWLNDSLIWSDYDTTTGNDTLPPTEFHAGACWIDWGEGNRAQVWVDSCAVIAQGGQEIYDTHISAGNRAGLELYISQNPLSKKGNIFCRIPNISKISITVYDFLGREIKRLAENIMQPPGLCIFPLDPKDFSPGIYFIVLRTENSYATKKVVFFK